MTRINLVPVEELYDQHLLAEHREIKRIPNIIKNNKISLENIPEKYVLGKGHIKFFCNKLLFLKNRYIQLYNECIKRGFKVENYLTNWEGINKELFNEYNPSIDDINLSKNRIQEKVNKNPGFYKYTKIG